MKKYETIDHAKHTIEGMLGKDVVVHLNRGRNKIFCYNGVIAEAYNNVFVVKVYNELFDVLSCTYNEMLCGEVKLQEKNQAKKIKEKKV